MSVNYGYALINEMIRFRVWSLPPNKNQLGLTTGKLIKIHLGLRDYAKFILCLFVENTALTVH